MSPIDQIESAVLQLPRNERARIAERLLASLDDDAEVERAWADEVRRRVEDLRSGKVRPIPGEDVFKELESLYQ